MAAWRNGLPWCLPIVVLLAGQGGHLIGAQRPQAALVLGAADGPIAFAAGEIRRTLDAAGVAVAAPAAAGPTAADVPVEIILTVQGDRPGQPAAAGLQPGGFAIRRTQAGGRIRIWTIGYDAAATMYGGLELAEDVRIGTPLTAVAERLSNPYLEKRGIKFNIPLDARTPSYSDDSTSAQANIPEMWSLEFWREFLDEMARHRFNYLSLWSLSPFPSLVRVPEYPNVALADVKRAARPLWDATLQGRGMFDPGWPLETVRTLTIDGKIAFWRRVMALARDRGIEVSVFTWNIFVYGTEGSGYGITADPANATTRDYIRRSVRALFNTYPLLSAVGVTSGENMGGLDDAGKERWMWESYGLGVADAIADARNPASPFHAPGRKISLIHRAHQADLRQIIAAFGGLPGIDDPESTLSFSFKYSQAHMHSTTAPRFIFQNDWFDTIPAGKKTWLTVRNDDMYYLRSADPDFARAYWRNLPDRSKIAGFYMGPDGYTWGRDFLSRDAGVPRQTVIARQWFSFLVWGRLAFDPDLPNSRLQSIVAARLPDLPAERVFAAWTRTARILPAVTRLYWGSLDFQWYPEACWNNTGFVTARDFIMPKYPPMGADEDGQAPRMMSVRAFVDGQSTAGLSTPIEVAASIEGDAAAGLAALDGLAGRTRESRHTVEDIRAMAWLGRYYAAKIRGAVDLYRFERTGSREAHAAARRHLQAAAGHWRQYAGIIRRQYVAQTLTRMGLRPIDVGAIQAAVDADVPAELPVK